MATTSLRPKTVETYRGLMERYVFPAWGSRPLEAIAPADVKQLLADVGRHTGPATVLRQLDASIDGTLHEPPRALGDGWARRQRAMRALGYLVCPACGGSIADEATVRRLGVEEVSPDA